MSYANDTDFKDFLGDDLLAQFSAESGATISSTRLLTVLAKASSFMDGYLGGRYIVPVTNTKALEILKTHCLEIAKAILMGRRLAGHFDQTGGTDLCFEAIAWLKRVSDRKASLAGATELLNTTTGSTGATMGSDAIIFADPFDTSYGGGLI